MFDTPDAVFRAAVAAVNAEDWPRVAAACDPASLSAFKRHLIEQVDPAEPMPSLTMEQFTRHNPGMPREVAEYQYAQYRAATDPRARLAEEIPAVRDVAELKRMESAEVFAGWLEGRTPRRIVERLLQNGRIGTAAANKTLEQLPLALDFHPIGVVYDGDRVAHVLYHHTSTTDDACATGMERWIARMPPEEQALARDLANRQHPFFITCRRQPDGTWRLIADRGFLTLDSMGIALDDETSDEPTDK